MIRLAICDDDPRTLEEAGQIIQACGREGRFQQLIEVAAFQSSQALADNVEDGELYDVFLLDVEMPGLDGISLGWRIRQKRPDAVILFLTSHSSMTITAESVKLKVLRYVSKLEMDTALPEALQAAVEQVESQTPFYLLVTRYHDVTRVAYQEILYVHRVKRLTEIVLWGRPPVLDGRALSEVYSALNDPRFVLIERGCFVNLDYVTRISGQEVVLRNGERLQVSRNLLSTVKNTVFQLWGGVE